MTYIAESLPKNDSDFYFSKKSSRNIIINSKLYIDHDFIRIYSNEEFINTAASEGWPGDGTQSSPIIIDGLNITGSITIPCIDIQETDLFFQISNCLLNNIGTGIQVWNVENGNIFNNTITNTGAPSLERWGIAAGGESGANKNIFASNTIVNTQYPFDVGGNDNLIVNNNLFDQGNGIWVTGNNNVVANNSIQDAGGGGGIVIRNSVNTTISRNFLYRNWEGITLENSNDSTISSNNIRENGYGVHFDPYSAHNLVSLNIFRMNTARGISQAVDDGNNNIFTQNYWHEWTSPDVDEDGFVDNPYTLDGLANNGDYLPLVSTDQINVLHLLSIPTILQPEEGATLNRTVVIQWSASIDSEGHSVFYTLSYSLNNGNSWTLIASDFTSTSYSWDIPGPPLGSKVLLQIVATCSEGSSVTYFSARPYNIPPFDWTIPLLLGGCIIILSAGLTLFLFRSKFKPIESFTDFIQSAQIDFIRSLYHKVVIGLENIQVGVIPEPVKLPDIDVVKPTTMTTYFPPDFQEDLKTRLKGRTVLTLIEIAYQYPNETTPSSLSTKLDIPRSTLSTEIKRLTQLKYVEPFVSIDTLRDTRYKRYLITPKGLTFLRILKGALEISIVRLKERDIGISY